MASLTLLTQSPDALNRDLAQQLREMAVKADRGEITDFAAAFVEKGQYTMFWACSLSRAIVLTSLAQKRACERMEEG
jgi:hypothetical protein